MRRVFFDVQERSDVRKYYVCTRFTDMSAAEHTASYTVVCSAQQSLCASVLSVPPLPEHRISKRRGELRRRTCGLGMGYDSTFCRPSSLLPDRLHPGVRTDFAFSKVIRCNALLQSIADMIKFVDVNFHQIGSREFFVSTLLSSLSLGTRSTS